MHAATFVDMSLQPCPKSPNCVSTQADPDDSGHYMKPHPHSSDIAAALDAIEAAIASAGGEVTGRDDASIDAVFTSGLFRFKDDVRFEVDSELIHFRSASRTGHSDVGANRKRMESLVGSLTAL